MTRERKEIVASPTCKYTAIRRQTGGHAAYTYSRERGRRPKVAGKIHRLLSLETRAPKEGGPMRVLFARARGEPRRAHVRFARFGTKTDGFKPESSVLADKSGNITRIRLNRARETGRESEREKERGREGTLRPGVFRPDSTRAATTSFVRQTFRRADKTAELPTWKFRTKDRLRRTPFSVERSN